MKKDKKSKEIKVDDEISVDKEVLDKGILDEDALEDKALECEVLEEILEAESTIDNELAKINNKLVRTLAEYDNFRKRSNKEKTELFDLGASMVIEKLITVVDDFERALLIENCKDEDFRKGMELVYKNFMVILESLDVKEIDAKNEKFDHNLHYAVAKIDKDDVEEGQIIEVMQKGYTYKDKILRYAMVSVAN